MNATNWKYCLLFAWNKQLQILHPIAFAKSIDLQCKMQHSRASAIYFNRSLPNEQLKCAECRYVSASWTSNLLSVVNIRTTKPTTNNNNSPQSQAHRKEKETVALALHLSVGSHLAWNVVCLHKFHMSALRRRRWRWRWRQWMKTNSTS